MRRLTVELFDDGLRAFARFCARGGEGTLEIVGEGPLDARLRGAARQLGLGERVRFLGRRSSAEVQALMRDSHVLLVPSVVARDEDREGGVTVAKEASACGTVVVGNHTVRRIRTETGEDGASRADAATWRVMYRTSKPLRPQASLRVLDRQGEPIPGQTLTVSSVEGEGRAVIDFPTDVSLGTLLDQAGELPLPPYIVKQRQHSGLPAQPDDQERYQTVYAKVLGSVAAPTAGLHFTDALLAQLQRRGIERHSVTLHVGPGTFLPLRDDDPTKHVMHAERFHIPPETTEAIACARKQGRKVLAVGTTVVRTLESATPEGQSVPTPGFGESRLFIYPQPPTGRYPFRVVDALITNFHLPRSTLLMLVSAFAGRERILAAYQQAILARYRFYSYGDCMLV